MTSKEFGDTIDNTWRVDTVGILVSFLGRRKFNHLRLALEVLHYIQESIIYIGLFDKLDLHLVKVT
jgi:hypothetical protein